MKILLAITLFGTVSSFGTYSNFSKVNIENDGNIKAYRCVDDKNTPDDDSDDTYAYHNTLACQQAFIMNHPEYVPDGKEIVSETIVLTCI